MVDSGPNCKLHKYVQLTQKSPDVKRQHQCLNELRLFILGRGDRGGEDVSLEEP